MCEEVIIYGLGVSGLGAKKLLDYIDVKNYVFDDKIASSSNEIFEINLSNIKYVVKSPGISWENKYIKYFLENKVKVISEIELAMEYIPKCIKFIAFTGTNGKTTTTTKTYELLKKSGKKVMLAGNVGISFCDIVKNILEEKIELEYIVLELSSYQLENSKNLPIYIAGIINLTPDHLARYKDVNEYYETKFNIFDGQLNSDFMIINEQDMEFKKIYSQRKYNQNKLYVSKNTSFFENKIDVSDEFINYSETLKLDKNRLSLKGEHNLENILFILSVAKILNIEEKIIEDFVYSTKSIEHRMEDFYKIGNIEFINDSKGTNTDSTIKAILSYKEDIYLILGGEDKKIDNTKLVEIVKERVKKVYLIGSNHLIFKDLFDKFNYTNYEYLENIYNVSKKIKMEIEDGIIDKNKKGYILFSPATSSFDQFLNFEDRGNKFKEAIRSVYE